ncbi:MAG: hypothetical protein JSV66_02375 [Trueperaceae bacterium]|nr:MAG: hypothetical protein JSV66_02375 [Trueperaceae bacterium]
MKTTVELPDQLFREAKVVAAQRGQTLRQFLTEALAEKLESAKEPKSKPWMRHFGSLKEYKQEIERIDAIIEDEFERVDPAEWT